MAQAARQRRRYEPFTESRMVGSIVGRRLSGAGEKSVEAACIVAGIESAFRRMPAARRSAEDKSNPGGVVTGR